MRINRWISLGFVAAVSAAGCGDDDDAMSSPGGAGAPAGGSSGQAGSPGDAGGPGAAGAGDGAVDPDTAPEALVDRFSEEAGMLFVRSDDNGLPEAGDPVDFDQPPFITRGLGPAGELIWYYNFDVQRSEPAPIYVLVREGEDTPVEGQLNVVGVVPGDADYNDFWDVMLVTVEEDYVANTVTSVGDIMEHDYAVEEAGMLVNCPIVPNESTAELRFGDDEDAGLTRGWYDGEVVYYFNFAEAEIEETANGTVPTSPIFVTFNVNPAEDDPDSGPVSGFVTEDEEPDGQTHNVAASLPGDADYSPLWSVSIYDNADFDSVSDLSSALDAAPVGPGPLVNCPIVSVEEP
jgi:hypothetical protein